MPGLLLRYFAASEYLTDCWLNVWYATGLKTFLFIAFIVADAPETDKRDLNSELELMKTLKRHPHVIKLLGCVTESGVFYLKYLCFKQISKQQLFKIPSLLSYCYLMF